MPEAAACDLPPVEVAREQLPVIVGRLIAERHALLEERCPDWDVVVGRHRPRFDEAADYETLWRCVDALLAELGDPHTRVHSCPWFTVAPFPFIATWLGTDLVLAQQLPLSVGGIPQRIVAVDGRPVRALLEEAAAVYPYSSEAIWRSVVLGRVAKGSPGQTIGLTLEGADGAEERCFSAVEPAEFATSIGIPGESFDTPKPPLCMAHRQGRIGVLRIFSFAREGVDAEIRRALDELGAVDGLVLDVRGNGGGLLDATLAATGIFVAEEVELGSREDRSGAAVPLRVRGCASAALPPRIAVVCDSSTMSTAEFVFVKALKCAGAATVVGDTTAGLVHDATVIRMFDGTRLQVTTFKHREVDGSVVAEAGITPDIVVNNGIESLLDGVDRQMEAALATLAS